MKASNDIHQYICGQIFVILISCSITLIHSNEWNGVRRENSLSRPYQGSGMTIPNWDFSGSTIVTQQFIRLTPDQQSRKGSIWNNKPIYYRNWEVQLHFRISGHGKDLFGDGMAFWYVKEQMKEGEVFGYVDQFHGLGIFMDTYANQNGAHNHGHPYISAMVNNGTLHYDHDRDGTHTELMGCEAKIRGSDHDTVLLIRYENDVLTVSTDVEGKGTWKECFTVRDVLLPTNYYLGVTASNGDLSDNHDIISIKTFELDPPPASKDGEDRAQIVPSASFFAPPRDHIDDPPPPMSGIKFFMLIVCALIGLVVCVVVGAYVYQQKQQASRRRFY